MRIDAYTKAVLTVIAVCVVWLSLGGPNLLSVAHAQTTFERPFPSVIKSPDFGYRVDGWRGYGQAPLGTLVVNIDGMWYEARLTAPDQSK